MRRLLVTGLDGFVGQTLANLLRDQAGSARWTLCPLPAGFDLLDAASVRDLVSDAAPEAIIHLAAQSNVALAHQDPELTLRVNVLGTLHLLQAARAVGLQGRIVHAGSGDVYGVVPEARLPIDEDVLPVPRNPYAVSKLAAEALCRQWTITEGLDVMLARSFNHIGPGQSPEFATSGFARQVARIKLGRQTAVIRVGDLDVTRDFTDASDVARAYLVMLERGTPGRPYNVCSGRETRLRDVLDRLIALAGIDVAVEVDPSRLRSAEQRRVRGSAARLERDTGWAAATPLDATLAALLEYWIRREDGER